jgi:hypothetical protein
MGTVPQRLPDKGRSAWLDRGVIGASGHAGPSREKCRRAFLDVPSKYHQVTRSTFPSQEGLPLHLRWPGVRFEVASTTPTTHTLTHGSHVASSEALWGDAL